MRALRALRLFLALAACAPALALDPSRLISQYHKRTWQIEDGLPHNYVSAIHQLPDGWLLVGTDQGLARFDGLRFVAPPLDAALRLPQRWILSLLTARDGSLWIGTFDGWVIRSRAWRVASKFNAGGSVFDLFQDSSGTVWASTRAGVFRFDGPQPRRVEGLEPPPETGWNVLAEDRERAVWVVTVSGLFQIQDKTVRKTIASGALSGEVLSVSIGAANNIWVGTSTGLFELRGQRLTRRAGVPGPVVATLRDRDGVLWAGTWGKGVFRVTAAGVSACTSRDGLPDDFIRTLSEDGEGNLWIGTRGGLSRWKDTILVPYGVPEGLSGNFATTVAAGQGDDLWLGTWRGGLYRLRNGRLQPQPTPVPTLFFAIRALTVDPRGRAWIGNWEGLYCLDGRGYRHFAGPGSPYHHVSAILFDSRGRLWVGTEENGIFLFEGGEPADAATRLAPQRSITSLVEDAEGRVWAGTSQGAGWFDAVQPAEFHQPRGVPAEAIESIARDTRNRLWACTPGGALVLLTPARATVLDVRQGLPAQPLYRALDDGAGSFWISSQRGILQVPAAQIDQVLRGERPRLDAVSFDQEDGMRTIECHGLSQPAGWKHHDGSLWFPTAKGFVRIQPARQRRLPPPAVIPGEVLVNGKPVATNGDAELPAGARNVELRFSALRLSAASKLRFRYRMEGFDPDWVEAAGERSARYSRLSPGRHRFILEAADPGGPWSEPLEIPIAQLPRFYETKWFTLLLALAALSAAAGIYAWRMRLVKGRYAAVLAERNRIAREWHDTLVAGFSAISLQLEATLARLKDHPGKAAEIVEVTRRMVHHYRAEARRVIWDLRDSRPETEQLAEAVSSALQRATEGRPVAGSVEVTGQPVPLARDLEHNVLRICQEAAANALRHGHPEHLRVRLEYAPAHLVARIEDDGAGFDPSALNGIPSGHFGLTVMQERARRFGGQLRIDSAPGRGTAVEATIPIAPRSAS